MALIAEDGTGIVDAEAYVGLGFAGSYLDRRNKSSAWEAASKKEREAALVKATEYIDKRFGSMFKGEKKFLELDSKAFNFLLIETIPTNGQTVTIGTNTFTFRTVVSVATDVLIGVSIAACAVNLTAKINAISSVVNAYGSYYTSSIIEVKHKLVGEQPSVACSCDAFASWDYSSLLLKEATVEQPLLWPRVEAFSVSGKEIVGIPESLKEATVEYAVRALSEDLMPDPTVSTTGQDVLRLFEKVGPIETETEFSSSAKLVFKKFPEVDKLLNDLMVSSGSVFR